MSAPATAVPYQLSRAYRHADLRVPYLLDSRSGEVMCCRWPLAKLQAFLFAFAGKGPVQGFDERLERG